MASTTLEIAPKPYLIDRVLLLNGLTRAGKFLLGKLVSGIQSVEHFQYVSVLEHLPYLTRLGLVHEDAAIALMRIHVDEHAYNAIIGRNVNTRISDASSVFNLPHFHEYFSRSLSDDIPALLAKARKDRYLPAFIIHESLPFIRLLLRGFPEAKVLDLQRHPIDLASSWFQRGWGSRQGDDPLSFAPVFKGPTGVALPWHAESWKEEYESSSPVDRVIRSIGVLVDEGERAYARLDTDQKARMWRFTYEDLVEHTEPTVQRIAAFLELPVRATLAVIMAKEGVPRPLPAEARLKKLQAIERIASPGARALLHELSTTYERTFARAAGPS